MELEQGTLIHDRYRIQETLGKGGMGAVYTALDETLGVYVAVKENLLEDENAIQQFRREAIILANLRHQNLPRVTDHFVIEGQGQYLVMDFIKGEDLKMRMQRLGALSEKEVLLIGVAISDALNYLHGLQPPVLHRDVKPGNIRITPDGHVFLVDFGLAKQVESGQVTATGARGLTPGFSPPEQYGTARTDARSDIYALGATLYTLLTGFPPEDGLAVAIKQTQLTPVRSRNPKVSQAVAESVEKALSVDPANRQQSGAELRRELLQVSDSVYRQVATGDVTVTPPPPGATKMAGDDSPTPARETVAAVDATPGVASPSSTPVGEILPRPQERSAPAVGAPPKVDADKKPFPVALVAGIGLAVVLVIVGVMVLPGLLGGADRQSPAVIAPTETEHQSTRLSPEEETPEDQLVALPTNTLLPTNTNFPTDTAQPSPPAEEPAQPTELDAAIPTRGGGMIAFASTRSGEPQIFLLDLALGEQTQLTDLPGGACQPEWSNDGMRLVFIAPCNQNQQSYAGSSLFIIDADGTQMNPLPSSPIGDYDPSWSPVDNRIVFTTIRDFDRPQIWVLDVDSGQSVNLSQNTQADYQPSWSADGSKILFSSNRVIGRAKLWVMDADGQNVVEFSRSDNRTNIEAVWSPDGDQVVFTQFDSQGRGIPILVGTNWHDGGPEAGLEEYRLSDDPAGMREADFSPDGLWIVFSINSDPANLDLFMMRLDGSEMTPLVVNDSNDFDPAWRP
jgi:serine/threonine protein kinase/Tol biopolymer transport system component